LITNEDAFRSVSTLSTKLRADRLVYTDLAHMAQVSPLACNVAFLICAKDPKHRLSKAIMKNILVFMLNYFIARALCARAMLKL